MNLLRHLTRESTFCGYRSRFSRMRVWLSAHTTIAMRLHPCHWPLLTPTMMIGGWRSTNIIVGLNMLSRVPYTLGTFPLPLLPLFNSFLDVVRCLHKTSCRLTPVSLTLCRARPFAQLPNFSPVMGYFKNYFKPVKAQQEAKARQDPVVQSEAGSIEMKHSSPQILASPLERPASINHSSGTPWQSRPASLLASDGLEGQEITEMKCEVMVSWLHQQQLEKLWFESTAGEGVVLRKSKGVYICCPEKLAEESTGFCSAIETLNVKVRTVVMTRVVFVLTALVRDDRQDPCSQTLSFKDRQTLCSVTKWSTSSGPPEFLIFAQLPEAPICGFRS